MRIAFDGIAFDAGEGTMYESSKRHDEHEGIFH